MGQFKYPLAGLSSLAGQAGGGGGIKSIQTVTSVDSATTTISSVDINQSFILPHVTTDDTNPRLYPYAELTNSTTISWTADASVRGTQVVTVIEFDGLLKSVQRGTIAISGSNTTNTATITAVDTSKAFANYCLSTSDSNDTLADIIGVVELINSTTVQAELEDNPGPGRTYTFAYEVVEFK
jgi:hypothetical protein